MPYIVAEQRKVLDSDGFFEEVAVASGQASMGRLAFLSLVIQLAIESSSPDWSSAFSPSGYDARQDSLAKELANRICSASTSPGAKCGVLNYALTRLLLEAFPSPRYADLNDAVGLLESLRRLCHPTAVSVLGVLACCQLEFYRKFAAPYEDLKEVENGAVFASWRG